MSMVIVLDTGPLSLLASPVKSKLVRDANQWAIDMLAATHQLMVPAIADYEVRRELERLQLTRSLLRLNAFNSAVPDRYLSISDDVLLLGAKLWGSARNRGTPTGDPHDLDCDVLIAAQAIGLNVSPDELVIATTNVGHLSQFVRAALWTDIKP